MTISERRYGVLLPDATSTGATDDGAGMDPAFDPKFRAGRDHRRLAGVDRGDDFGVVDPLQIPVDDGVVPELDEPAAAGLTGWLPFVQSSSA
jgi:hypothetical protein